jgi:hypothetical protein
MSAERPGTPRSRPPGGRAIFELAHPTQITALATTRSELDKAAVELAQAIRKIGVAELSGELARCELVEVGGTADQQSGASKQSTPDEDLPPEPKTPKTWVEFRLIDMEGNPVGNMHYTVVLPGGATEDGYLDSSGSVRFSGIDPGECTITFPDLDRDAWDWASQT